VNILDVMGHLPPVPPLSIPAVQAMLDDRKETYRAFAQLESQRGFLLPEISLATSKGQELGRILLMRFFEECTEAFESGQRPHHLEEIVDATNYLFTLLVIDPAGCRPEIVTSVYHCLSRLSWNNPSLTPEHKTILHISK
jgi:hypothetical protein